MGPGAELILRGELLGIVGIVGTVYLGIKSTILNSSIGCWCIQPGARAVGTFRRGL